MIFFFPRLKPGFPHYDFLKKTLCIFLIALSFNSMAIIDTKDCIHQAAQCFSINPILLKAIILQESGCNQNAIHYNSNNTYDVGVMQINSIHFQSFSKFGISKEEIKRDSCTNVFSGAWILNQRIKEYGYNWEGIGTYHSKTPRIRDKYIYNLISIINKNHSLNNISIPYQHGLRERFFC